MMQLCILLLAFAMASSLSLNAKSNVQKFNNKDIVNLNQIRIKKSTKKLFIKNNPIDSIQEFSFPNNLKTIKFISNDLSTINGLTLGNKTKILELTNNNVSSVKNLNINSNLKELHFFNENLSGDFTLNISESNLTFLNLAFNEISTVQNVLVPDSLLILDLVSNELTSFNGAHLNPGLQELYLHGNPINSYSEITNLNDNLEVLSIGSRGANSQRLIEFSLPSNLVKLSIINTLSLSKDDLLDIDCLNNTNLKKLDLSRNNISTLNGLEFPKSLRKLILTGNPINKEERRKIKRRFKKENPKLKIVF